MSLLDDTFEELLSRLQDPDALNPAKSDPFLYFVYPPGQMLELKKHFPRWTTKLTEAGFHVIRLSLSELVWQLVDASGRWEAWLEVEPSAEIDQLNESIRDVLRSQSKLTEELANRIAEAPENGVILLTEVEMLHPYFRMRTIESYLHDKVTVPTIVFYPGRRSGQYGLHFLDFYPHDGNYRSTLIGGS